MSRRTRQKASDVFQNTEYVFSRKAGFEEALPEIADLKVVVAQEGEGVRNWNQTSHLGRNNAGEYFDCKNPLCYNGGFHLGEMLREMVRKKETHKEDTAICQGYEGSPKGRKRYRSCMNFFRATIDISYKAAADYEK